MHTPAHFRETRVEVLHQLIRDRPLATLVTVGEDGVVADHVPLHLCADGSTPGVLQGHVARANPLWNRQQDGAQVLAVFNGPDAYISPSWYPTKTENGKAVPTWNYVAVHAYGKLSAKQDRAWIFRHLDQLTAVNEAGFDRPWKVSDAPERFIAGMLDAVVGIEIEITRLLGKWKASQNQPDRNQAGVRRGLVRTGPAGIAMAAVIEGARQHDDEDGGSRSVAGGQRPCG